MSVYPPPNEQKGTIFNPLDYIESSGTIDSAYLEANYLQFPVAQGTENFSNILVAGSNTTQGQTFAKGGLIVNSGALTANLQIIPAPEVALNDGTNNSKLTTTQLLFNGVPFSGPAGGATLAGNQTFTGLNTFSQTIQGGITNAITATQTQLTLENGSTNGYIPFFKTNSTASQKPFYNPNIYFDPSTTTLQCNNLNGNALTCTTAQKSTVTTNATNASFYLPFISGVTTGGYALQANSTISINPQSGSLVAVGTVQGQTVTVQATANARALNLLNGGLQMLWNAGTTQYTQIQCLADIQNPAFVCYQVEPAYGLYYNFNTQGLLNTATTPAQKPRLEIGCGEALLNEIDFCSSSSTNIGGFYFYTKSDTVALSLIGKIVPTQPVATDSGQTLATTAFVQSAISANTGGYATLSANPQTFTGRQIFNNFCPQSPITPSASNDLVNLAYIQNLTNSSSFTITNTSSITSPTFTVLLNSITLTGLTNNGIFFLNNGSPNLQNYMTVRINYCANDDQNTSIVNFTAIVMLFPQRISGNVAIASNFGLGAVPQTIYNLNNNLNNNTTFGYTVGTYAVYGRQYYSTAPNGGTISGVSTELNTLFLNGQYAVLNGVAKFGFNLRPFNQTTIPYGTSTTVYTSISLDVLYNPDPSVSISFANN